MLFRSLYGSGLRQAKCLELRIKDLDFQQLQIIVRYEKGGKDRLTPMPKKLIEPLQDHLRIVKYTHQQVPLISQVKLRLSTIVHPKPPKDYLLKL